VCARKALSFELWFVAGLHDAGVAAVDLARSSGNSKKAGSGKGPASASASASAASSLDKPIAVAAASLNALQTSAITAGGAALPSQVRLRT
jgi:hypothetical protein